MGVHPRQPMSDPVSLSGPDLAVGVPLGDVPDGGTLVGRVGEEPVLLVRRGDEVFAVLATCAHYGAPLADGIVVDCELRCPWHHARFDARTGEAIGPPALRPIATFEVIRDGAHVRVGAKRAPAAHRPARRGPASIVIVGAGAAGDAAAATLRAEGYEGAITLFGRDDEPQPIDRPNLSKDYLAGTAPEEWLPLRDASFYAEQAIALRPGVEVRAIDPAAHRAALAGGESLEYGALLLATGASPIRLDLSGASLPHVFTLRTLADSRAIAARAAAGGAAVVIGGSFIGLEVAAALRTRGLDVPVVAPETRPPERILGPELGDFGRGRPGAHGGVVP